MATWVRAGTGYPSALDGDVTGTLELTNGTAPGDFDETAVTSVQIAYTVQIQSGAYQAGGAEKSDVHGETELTLNGNGATLAAINQADGILDDGTNGGSSVVVDQTDNAPSVGNSVAEWEGAELNPGPGTANWSTFTQNKGADGVTVEVISATVTITYTPAAGAQDIAPALAQQLTAALDPTVAPGSVDVSPTLEQQLTAAFDPSLGLTIKPALVQQLVRPVAYLDLPGTAGNNVSTPDANPLDITDDFKLRMLVAVDDYTLVGVLASKWEVSGNERSWFLRFNAIGRLDFWWSTDGTAAANQGSNAPASAFIDGDWYWVEVEFTGGDIIFRSATESEGEDNLVQISSHAVATSINSGTAPVVISITEAGFAAFAGGVKRVKIWDSTTLEFDADFTDLTSTELAAGAFTEDSVNAATVTLNGSDWTYEAAALSPGPVDVSPVLYQQLAAALDPTDVRSTVDIAPALTQQLATGIAPSVGLTIKPDLVQQLATGIDPTVTPGPVDISPALTQQPATGIAPTVSLEVAQDITPVLTQQPATGIAPTDVRSTVDIAAALVQQLATGVGPTVAPGLVDIAPTLVQQLATGVDPVVSPGAVDIAPDLVQHLARPVSNALDLPGTAGNHASTPDINAWTPTLGDLEIRWDTALDDYAGVLQTVLSHWAAGGDNRSWWIHSDDDATPDPTMSLDMGDTDGTFKEWWNSYPHDVPNGERYQFRMVHDGDNGAGGRTVDWYKRPATKSLDDNTGWTLIRSETRGGTFTAFKNAATAMYVGANNNGSGNLLNGRVYRIILWVDGSVEFDADFTDLTVSELTGGSFVEDSTNAVTVSLNGTGWGYEKIRFGLDLSLTLTQQLAAGIDPSLGLTIKPALTQQLATGVDPTVSQAGATQDITPSLEQQLATGIAPTDVRSTVDIAPALVQQLATGIDPTVGLTISPALVQQLATGIDPVLTPGAIDVAPDLTQQLATGIDPSVRLTIAPALVQQLATGIDPSLGLNITLALVQQLATGVDPVVALAAAGAQDIAPVLTQQLATGIDPILSPGAVDVTPVLVQQLASGIDPSLGMAIALALVQQLATGIDPTLVPGSVDISPVLAQQLTTAFDPFLGLTISPALTQQLATGVDPILTPGPVDITPALVQQLATAYGPVVAGGIVRNLQWIASLVGQNWTTDLTGQNWETTVKDRNWDTGKVTL